MAGDQDLQKNQAPKPNTPVQAPIVGESSRPPAPQNNAFLRDDKNDNPLIPDDDQLALLTTNVQANKVATADTLNNILADLTKKHTNAGVPDLVSLAWSCYHNGSSRYTTLDTHSPNNVHLAEIKDIVESHCTLRQFCTYYSKICYNMGRSAQKPPANWAAKGFSEDTKYAAYDFFNGVLNPAAPPPKSGMKFKPTEAEIKAHAVNSTMAIMESRPQANGFSTRGNMMAMQQIRTQPTNPLITFE